MTCFRSQLSLLSLLFIGFIMGCGKGEYDRRLEESAVRLRNGEPAKSAADEAAPGEEEYVDPIAEEDEQTSRAPSRPPAGGGGGGGLVSAVRGAVSRSSAQQGMKNLGLAIVNYETATSSFPPRGMPLPDGSPGLSWRVAILPYLDQKPLYDQFHLDEPWDSAHNRPLVDRMPSDYVSEGLNLPDGKTVILAVGGADSALDALQKNTLRDLRDGVSHTAFVIEANEDQAVFWTQPADYEWSDDNPAVGLGRARKGVFLTILGDGTVVSIDANTDSEQLSRLFRKGDGQVVADDIFIR
ncbi:MAG: DUF1559 domain-containing protein [Planctomycetales bacterium]|nr:DUF1559 domain-containing protein [Planctomycetales bacterium]